MKQKTILESRYKNPVRPDETEIDGQNNDENLSEETIDFRGSNSTQSEELADGEENKKTLMDDNADSKSKPDGFEEEKSKDEDEVEKQLLMVVSSHNFLSLTPHNVISSSFTSAADGIKLELSGVVLSLFTQACSNDVWDPGGYDTLLPRPAPVLSLPEQLLPADVCHYFLLPADSKVYLLEQQVQLVTGLLVTLLVLACDCDLPWTLAQRPTNRAKHLFKRLISM